MSRTKNTLAELPRGYTDMAGAMALTTFGETKVRELAMAGTIDARRYGRRVVYRIDTIEALMDALPPAYPAPAANAGTGGAETEAA